MTRALKFLAMALLSLLVLLVAAFGALQTPPGKALLAGFASSLASSPGLTVALRGLGGFVPFDMSVESIELSDAEGPFARIEGARLDWRPLALLSGRVDVTTLAAARVSLDRRPVLPPAPPSTDEGSSFALPVRLENLAIPDITLAEPVLGHAARLSLNGSADLASLAQGLSMTFALERLDAPGTLNGSAGYSPETGQLDLDVAAREPAGGLMARAAGFDGLPEIAASLKGAGPLDAWDGHLRVTVGDVAEASGAAGIRAVANGHRMNVAIDADIADILPANISPLFEGRSELAGSVTVDTARNIAIDSFTARTAGFQATVSGTLDAAETADLAFDATLADAARFAALAPGIGWQSLRLTGTLKGALRTPSIDGRIAATQLTGLDYRAGSLAATLRTLPSASGSLAFAVEGTADELTAADPQVAAALGTRGRFSAAGTLPPGEDAVLETASVELSAISARFAGRADAHAIDGDLGVSRLNLAAFSPLAGRPLAGTATLDARLSASTDLARASAVLKGRAQGLETGIARVDALVGQGLSIDGALARDGANALSVDNLKIDTDGIAATVNGRLASDVADLNATLALDDLGRIDPRLAGALQADAAFSGTLDALGVKATLRVPDGMADGRPLRDVTLDVSATDITSDMAGTFGLSGDVGGKPARGSATLATQPDGTRSLSGLDLAIGSVTARGDLALDPAGLATGQLNIVAGDLADIAALALTEMAGALNADVTLSVAEGRQNADVRASAEKLSAFGQTVGSANINGKVLDLRGVPLLDGTVDLRAAALSGVTVDTATLRAKGTAEGTDLTLEALTQGTNLRAAGRLEPITDGARLRLDRLTATRPGLNAALNAPATFTLTGGTIAIDRLALTAGGGSATVSGTAGDRLDLTVDLRALPLALVNLVAPDTNLSGTLAGTARLGGTASAPTGPFDLRISRLSRPDIASSGAGPFDIAANGTLGNGRAQVRATITGQNVQGLTLSGSVPLGAGDLDLALRGAINLAIVNPTLAATGARVTGIATVDATLRGSLAAPRAGGTARLSGGRFDDSVNGVALGNIEAVLTGTDRSVTLTSFRATTTNGGSISGRGNVALDPSAGYPGRIDLDLVNAALVNSDLMRLVAEGRLGIEGAFLNGPRLTGRLVLRALDINVPDRFPGGVQDLNVRHVNANAEFKSKSPTVQRQQGPAAPARNGIALDLVLSAPSNNVFVRGLGIEAQLGGELTLGGTTRAPVTSGGFQLRRGSFDFGGRRLTFTRGNITFTGNTDPELDFIAETTSTDITARVLVSGPASRPVISFSSTPTLPQDEVISRLLFGRSAGSLNGGQALQLAQAAAQFSGGAGVLENVRRSLGVDSLELGTDAEGTGGQVGVGRRLNDNIYLGVRQGTSAGSSRVTVDVDVTKNIRLQGATGANGAAEVGIGAQWDY
ncbi:autotransporter secretion inner membrane protein TamB [Ancylobacter aquaticus]|uniref:Autotransporter secretion inner membrane protein TamB n=1 Tax=Ancylobacter aquaticus TaxID=100 RepID=A0A4R1I8G0_ANCAQ|nr:translocation/assembly module TamB domain-containing protein [Ancylobacter aquaticus]TCK31734.1 autotransporter secretion inner membrane protein TamB [Ancylobacter aquaticus]